MRGGYNSGPMARQSPRQEYSGMQPYSRGPQRGMMMTPSMRGGMTNRPMRGGMFREEDPSHFNRRPYPNREMAPRFGPQALAEGRTRNNEAPFKHPAFPNSHTHIAATDAARNDGARPMRRAPLNSGRGDMLPPSMTIKSDRFPNRRLQDEARDHGYPLRN